MYPVAAGILAWGWEMLEFPGMGKGNEKVRRFDAGAQGQPGHTPAVRGGRRDPSGRLRGTTRRSSCSGGDVFPMLERVRRGLYRRPFICVNVDMVGGVCLGPKRDQVLRQGGRRGDLDASPRSRDG